MRTVDLRHALGEHERAVGEFAARIAALTATQWNTPRAEGKWTPAQETMHVVMFHDVANGELKGGPPVRIRTGRFLHHVLRWRYLNRILETGRFPQPVRTVREARPPELPGSQPQLLEQLRDRTAAFQRLVREVAERAPRTKLTHPFFGRVDLVRSVRFMAVHTRHHANFLPSAPA